MILLVLFVISVKFTVVQGQVTVSQPSGFWGRSCSMYRYGRVENAILNRIFSSGYDPNVVPDIPKDATTNEIGVQVRLINIDSVANNSRHLDADLMVSQTWIDPGLKYNSFTNCKPRFNALHRLVNGKIWTPDLCFSNSHRATIHENPTPNVNWQFDVNGTVVYQYRIHVQVPCSVSCRDNNLQCQIILESCSLIPVKWINKELFNQWQDRDQVPNTIKLSQYRLYEDVYTYPAGISDRLIISLVYQRQQSTC